MTNGAISRNLLWIVMCLGLGLTALIIYFAPVPKLNTKISDQTIFASPATLPPDVHQLNMTQLTTRPLFIANRRPLPIQTPSVRSIPFVKPSPSTDGMVLLGIMHAGSKAVALVVLPGSSQPEEITVGAELGDWIVTKIKTDLIILKSGQFGTELTLPHPVAPSSSPGSNPLQASPFPPSLGVP